MKKYTVQLMGQEHFLKKIGNRGSLYGREFHSCDFTKNCWEANCRYERLNPAFIFEEVVEKK
ncbi:hypothetical protein [Lactococcus garvieae]|uniref:Uncharacterized protein n=1 Tax=Lactococcus garvieae DCC43 TaxID=1231377 RepID=K2PH73_9LACT|nr:hypothetical protein [Lactococcus garvieae]EKF50780.1 hypothetical protein C426_1831 [Lactococcus garvieae DCC43]